MKISVLISFFVVCISLFAQDKEVKIKEGGEFPFEIKYNNSLYKGSYYGSYTKSKIDGEKVKIPYGKGSFKCDKMNYDGEWIDGLFSGIGNFSIDSFTYVGSFLSGVKNGVGKITFKNKEVYEGEWSNDLLNGKGKYIYVNGDIYEGNFLNGLKQGFGKLSFKSNLSDFQKSSNENNLFNIYEGNFVNNEIEGSGKLICKDGYILNGEWKKFTLTGKGRLYLKNGLQWVGQIKENQPDGIGEMFYTNGDTYKGEWFDNNFNGKGIYTFKNGSKWDGNWKNGSANGFLSIYSENGDVTASGNYVDNKMNGIGFKMLNGNKWEGNWENNIPTGKGVIYFSNSNIYTGDWAGIKKESETYFYMHGKGKMKYYNGDVYEGDWFESKRQGLGKLNLKNGQLFEGEFKNDQYVEVFNPNTVKIGTQIWTSQNLNVDHFKNGDKIKQVNSYDELLNSLNNSEPAFCYLDFNPKNGEKYGKLYNIFALQDPRGLAPDGWRLPTVMDYKNLVKFLGGGNIAYDKLKTNEPLAFTFEMINVKLRALVKEIEKNEEGAEGLSGYIASEGDLKSTNETNTGNNLSGFNALPGSHYDNKQGPLLIYEGYNKKYYQSYEGYWSLFLTSDNGSLFLSTKSEITDLNKNLNFGSVRLLK